LGDTSVHSFTDLGMFWQLVTGILIFLVMSVWLLITRWKELPITKKDEETYSREFWMFVGSVFLGLSCFHLIVVTSIPVWNAILGTNIAPPVDKARLLHYNIVQSCFVVVITILTAFTQFLKYKKTDVGRFVITTAVYLFFAALIAALIVYTTGLYKLNYVFVLLMWGSVYSVIANGKVLADAFKGKFKLAGSAVAHIGFGLLIVGALISAGTSTVISINNTGESYSADFAKTENPRENILVYRNEPQKMGDYTVTYLGDSLALPDHFYKVNYRKVGADGKVDEDFTLFPKVQVNKGALASSPDTRHYLLHDLYTHITMTNSASTAEEKGATDGSEPADDSKDYDAPVPHEVAVGDTIPFREGYMVLRKLNNSAKLENISMADVLVSVGAELDVVTHGQTYHAMPVYMLKKNGGIFYFPKKLEEAGLKLQFSNIMPAKKKVEITVYQQPESAKKYIVMRAIKFPYINFFWAGTVIMVIGFFLSILRRNKELKPAPVVKAK
jgi:cytochrome c-type biogenesis protein CcmF